MHQLAAGGEGSHATSQVAQTLLREGGRMRRFMNYHLQVPQPVTGCTGWREALSAAEESQLAACVPRYKADSDRVGCSCLVTAALRILGDCASSSVRHKRILSWRPRLARKPKWRIFTKPRGSTWSRKRRMNSVACSVMMAGGLACL